eukprot:8620471-Pyramimonas_sp.AAC.1
MDGNNLVVNRMVTRLVRTPALGFYAPYCTSRLIKGVGTRLPVDGWSSFSTAFYLHRWCCRHQERAIARLLRSLLRYPGSIEDQRLVRTPARANGASEV